MITLITLRKAQINSCQLYQHQTNAKSS